MVTLKAKSVWSGEWRGRTVVIVFALAMIQSCLAAGAARSKDAVVYGPVSVATEGGAAGRFVLCAKGEVVPLYVDSNDSPTLRVVTNAFAGDIDKVTGKQPQIVSATEALHSKDVVIIGTIGHSSLLDELRTEGRLDTSLINGKWESAITTVVEHPFPNVNSALVIAGSDRRGAAYAVFELSRQMGVSPWNWWADVPVRHHSFLAVNPGTYIQRSPSVQYRGIFLNDEDWGLRPWAARKMDPELHNIGPHTYARIFELLLRLHANTLWPAMHPGTLPFNAVPENAILADEWGIVMGSSHSEALLRNNVGEWNEKLDGPWNYQINSARIIRYWDARLKTNGKFENIYTVGMRGVHDSPMEATGSPQEKARLVENIITEQQKLLSKTVNPNVAKIPQVIWLYKEVLNLYRVGMKIPEDVTLGWSDDNYGYIRELPDQEEQARSGGSALYYHVSYWGDPHDYLWLCSTPPALMREELTKAWNHGVRRMWILNVGDLKPAEMDIDYFLRMAWNEPATAQLSQPNFLVEWNKEQFPARYASSIAALMDSYYQLNFFRKPEFMGFNDDEEPIQRTAFNPLAWGDQNRQRLTAWEDLSRRAADIGNQLPLEYRDAYFELTGYPIEAAAAQNAKFLWNDKSYLDAAEGHNNLDPSDAKHVQQAYDEIQRLTGQYNSTAGGKWEGMMSSHPRNLLSSDLPASAEPSEGDPVSLPPTWGRPEPDQHKDVLGNGLFEQNRTISIDAAHFSGLHNAGDTTWHVRPELGPGGAVFFGNPGSTAQAAWIDDKAQPAAAAPWLEYKFISTSNADATLSVYLLPTFPVDSKHRLRYAVALDGKPPEVLDASGIQKRHSGVSPWSANVLRNSEIQALDLGVLPPGAHTLRLIYGDPGVVFQHIVVTFPGAPPAYPFPPETGLWHK